MKRYPPIQPRPDPSVPPPPPPPEDQQPQPPGQKVLAPRRTITQSACASCRQKKVKCDGRRPRCYRCARKTTECVYASDAAAGETTRRVAALQRRFDALEDETRRLRRLFAFLRDRPEAEALTIFMRVRGAASPLDVLFEVQDADLLVGGCGGGRSCSPAVSPPAEHCCSGDWRNILRGR
ncbi:hypothetical protein F4780DRAFT_686584 [Xylariomycetidae sp. FL0641]|nr:hypothetical protein F4780DRAFT_686584 [Xylariomycetidae sp. FL0641]